jgi:hypothetical protein
MFQRLMPLGMMFCVTVATACSSGPSPAVISISPTDPSDADSLKVNFVQYSLAGARELDDSDKDYDYEWFLTGGDGGLERQDALSEEGGIDEVDAALTIPGQEWTVQVTPIAPGGGEAGPSSSAVVSIRPVTVNVTVFSSTNKDEDDDETTAIVSDELECEWELIDFEGSDEDATPEWTNQEGDILGSDPVLSEGYFKGDTIRCTVTMDHEMLAGQSGSDELTIGNTAPSVTNVSVHPSSPSTEDILSCAYQAEDADPDDVLAARVSWTRNGAKVGFKNFAMGDLFTCGQQVGPAYECWGYDQEGVFSVPPVDFVELAHGDEHGCGLDSAGFITCWGSTATWNSEPSNSRPYVLVRAGTNVSKAVLEGVSCAIDVEGQIECWGDLSPNDPTVSEIPNEKAYIDIGMGASHICALDTDGYVECWGDPTNAAVTEVPSPMQFSEIVSGRNYACGLLAASRQPVCWGDKRSVGTVPSEQMFALDAGFDYTCGIRVSDETAVCWGEDEDNAVDATSNEPIGVPMQKVEAAGYASCGLDTAGNMHCWGQTGDRIVDNAPVGWSDDLQAGDTVSCSVVVGDGLATSDPETSQPETVTAP